MGALVDRLKRHLVGRWLITYFIDSPGPHYAPAIAFNAFVAIFPIALGLVSVLVLVKPNSPIARQVDQIILDVFPQGTRTEISSVIRDLNRHARTVGLVSLVAMLWAGTALFACLGAALNALHGTTGRNLIRQRLMGLRLILVMALGLGILILVEDVTAGMPPASVVRLGAAGLVLVMLLGFIYRVAPSTNMSPREVLPGAVIAAVLIEAATIAFPIYSRVTDEISTYGRGVALALVLMFWLYLVSHIVLLGAHFNDVRLDMREERAAAASGEVELSA
jgi:YihY family inner membrane protein